MGKKPISATDKDQLIILTASGSSVKSIAEQIDKTEQTVRNYQKKFAELIEAKKAELSGKVAKNISKDKAPANKNTPKTKIENAKENKEPEDRIEAEAEPKFARKGSDFASDELRDMYREVVRAGQSIIAAKMKYQKSLEQMGVPWVKFVDFSLTIGYDEIEQAYEREMIRYRDDMAMAAEIQERLDLDEADDIGGKKGEKTTMNDMIRMEREED